jgi:hypothetical protein
MKKVVLCTLLVLGLAFCLSANANADDLTDILQKKGVITEDEAKEAKGETKSKSFNVKERIDFSGDLRLRWDTQWREEQKPGADESTDYNRNRGRFRLRFGATADTTDTTEVGIRLVSGEGFQNTTNQSFDEHGTGKQIFIDRAYAMWEPADWFAFVGGKHKNPMFTFPLVWDPDVSPEGFSELFTFDVADGKADLFFTAGQWFIEELKLKDNNNDPMLFTYQLGTSIKAGDNAKIQLAATYYDYRWMDALSWSEGVLDDTSTFLGYNDSNGQQMVFDEEGNLLNEWGCYELGAKLHFKTAIPFSLFGNYIYNSKADTEELVTMGVDPGDSDPLKLEAYKGDDRNTGWQVGFDLGNKKKKGDWYIKYFYQVLEDYAFPAVFVDSDFHGGGTNNKGHYLNGRYLITDNIQFRATGFIGTEREDESKDGVKDEDRIQLDVIFAF